MSDYVWVSNIQLNPVRMLKSDADKLPLEWDGSPFMYDRQELADEVPNETRS